ncbi:MULTISPECIES: hypothetical protein [unclassified Streptomyces]|uniref:hypothetical protein n=1 Tax=unclassified Streptomyces TaxID=2593676 RepID=UPI000369CBFA|nr:MULTISPECIES: hypothetical protein [unclassified Streptomyces]
MNTNRTLAKPRRSVGDFDCSGKDVERDWVARTQCWSEVHRVLLTREQTLAYRLPATEGKKSDPRWLAFADRHGFDRQRPVQWEVEALEPDELRRLVMGAVRPYIDREALGEVLSDEHRQRRELTEFLRRW